MEEEGSISTGFDRGIDYGDIKEKLISSINKNFDNYTKEPTRINTNRLIYEVVGALQLRNASRVSEACKAFKLFLKKGINKRVIVKISKSDAVKTTKTGEKKKMPARYRELVWPNWFPEEIYNTIKNSEFTEELLNSHRFEKRVLDHLLNHHDTNTHSLRYACANYLIYEEERPALDVAKFMGHKDGKTILTYVQRKNVDQIFDMDM
jgi:hypothetical protein